MRDDQKEEFKQALGELYSYLKKELGIKKEPKLFLVSDEKNSSHLLGKTGYYNPTDKEIKIYISDRLPKDCLRTFSHECIHHYQHQENMFDINDQNSSEQGYILYNKNLREAEKHAYLLGNLLMRLWEDQKKAKDRQSGKKGV